MKTTIIQQIKDTEDELNSLQMKKKQKQHQLEKLQNRDRNEERKKRTRTLIEKGAILESIHPSLLFLSNDQLKVFLKKVVLDDRALQLVDELIKAGDMG